MILRLLETVVPRKRRQQLQHRIHMFDDLTRRDIVLIPSNLYEVVRHNPEVAREPLNLLICQKSNFEDIELEIVHEGPQFLRDLDPLIQRPGRRPAALAWRHRAPAPGVCRRSCTGYVPSYPEGPRHPRRGPSACPSQPLRRWTEPCWSSRTRLILNTSANSSRLQQLSS